MIIIHVFPVMNINICSARSTVWFDLCVCVCVCVCVCMFIIVSKLNCFKNVSFRHRGLLCFSFFHYKSDSPRICITVSLDPVALSCSLMKHSSITFFFVWSNCYNCLSCWSFDHITNLCACLCECTGEGDFNCSSLCSSGLLVSTDIHRQSRCIL